MTDLVQELSRLVAAPTGNPGGDEPALAAMLARRLDALGADEVAVERVPRDGQVDGANVWARFGTPRLLLNAHLDTVPVNAGWTGDPYKLRTQGDRLVGLGAADTKGAIAAAITALGDERPVDTAILFSGDEEHGGACMRAFLAGPHAAGLERAIVCEPTRCRVGTRHRGILAFDVSITGEGGHSSRADRLRAPLADLARLAVALDDWGRARRQVGTPGFEGFCVNIAKMAGGVASNVVPAEATLGVSVRPPPDSDAAAVREEIYAVCRQLIPDARLQTVIDNAPFRTRDLARFEALLGEVAKRPVDLGFWTEGAMLSAVGIDAVVFGPGDVAQAHAPDEWVSLAEVEQARRTFAAAFRATREGALGTR